jgi:hypothetical protein
MDEAGARMRSVRGEGETMKYDDYFPKRLAIVQDYEAGMGGGTSVLHNVRCDKCRHWGRASGTAEPGSAVASGDRICMRMTSGDREAMANARADWGYEAQVVTEPEFGCSMFESRETK